MSRGTKAAWTGRWRAGRSVLDNPTARAGTAIAPVVDGRWPGKSRGNRAAFFLRHGINGFWVIDQYHETPVIQSRFIDVKKIKNSMTYPISNDAGMFYVIETP